MAVKCLKCGYKMSTNQEIQSGLLKIIAGITEILKPTPPTQGIIAGTLNDSNFGKPVPCPKCKAKGQWEDY